MTREEAIKITYLRTGRRISKEFAREEIFSLINENHFDFVLITDYFRMKELSMRGDYKFITGSKEIIINCSPYTRRDNLIKKCTLAKVGSKYIFYAPLYNEEDRIRMVQSVG